VVVTPKAVTPCAGPRRPVPGRCLFVGGLNEPNRAGLAWLLAEIWLSCAGRHPDATLHVFGPIAATVASAPAGVTLRAGSTISRGLRRVRRRARAAARRHRP